jgi:hypothetical protein
MKKLLLPIVIVMMTLLGYEPCYAAFPIQDTAIETGSVIVDAGPPINKMQHDNGKAETAAGAGFGIAALCCGVVGFFVAGIPLGVLAIVFGVIGINKRLKGLAIAGVALGFIDIIGALIVLSAM